MKGEDIVLKGTEKAGWLCGCVYLLEQNRNFHAHSSLINGVDFLRESIL
jgi:hypothetical protein